MPEIPRKGIEKQIKPSSVYTIYSLRAGKGAVE